MLVKVEDIIHPVSSDNTKYKVITINLVHTIKCYERGGGNYEKQY